MKSKQVYLSMLVAGMAMGTAWAIRGQFGHEQGAAWAGGIGALGVLLVSKRTDWYNKVFSVVLAGALGWGIGGVMSYGVVVGYGRGTDFGNVYYGLCMLFVIGGLYGFLGGGLFGLAISSSAKRMVKWSNIIVEMVVGGLLVYFFFIEQFGWLMTPPRSEMWAACLGMALALTWYLVRNKQHAAMRVAVFAGLGGGFGFAFGNFLQVLGGVLEIKFNLWNVMEYSLGFFGGVGMTYGTLTSHWEVSEDKHKKTSQWFPVMMLVLVIPLIVWQQSFEVKRIAETYLNLSPADWTLPVIWTAFALVLLFSALWFSKYYFRQSGIVNYGYKDLLTFFAGHLGLYIVFSFLITGAFISIYRIEQYLYVINLVVILFLTGKTHPEFTGKEIDGSRWAKGMLALLVFIAILSFILVNTHGELAGSHNRFE